MKVIISRKRINSEQNEVALAAMLNFSFNSDTIVKVLPDDQVKAYVEAQAMRGFVCFEFGYTACYHPQTTIIKTQAA